MYKAPRSGKDLRCREPAQGIRLELFIDKNGAIKNIKVLKDPGHGFAEAAVAALTGITCIPAKANEKNCAVRYRYPIKFTLN
ncbi:MAG: energy transducer TonB [Treponema sp.]|nr:energy transducer TonB [Treponema sp.]